MNIGLRPTLAQDQPEQRVEVHLLDFQGDLYGQELEVTIVERVRDEKKFTGLDELRFQIGLDVARARQILVR
jgi:riboflavin kinase/FMN adenylyltransferase